MEQKIEITLENLYKLISFSRSFSSKKDPEECFRTFSSKFLIPKPEKYLHTDNGEYLYVGDKYYTVWDREENIYEPFTLYGPFTLSDTGKLSAGCRSFSTKLAAVEYLKTVERFAITKFIKVSSGNITKEDFVIYGDISYPTNFNSYFYRPGNTIPVTYRSMINLGRCYRSGDFIIGEVEIRKTKQRIGVGDIVSYTGEKREVSKISLNDSEHLIINFKNSSGNASSYINKDGKCSIEDIRLISKKDEKIKLFTTEDGVDIYDGDGQAVWELNTTSYNWTEMDRKTIISPIINPIQLTILNPNIKYFADTEKLKEYRYNNKPLLLTQAKLEKLIANSIETYNKVNSK